MNPNQLLTIILFLISATIFSVIVGGLVKQSVLPLKPVMDYSEPQLKFIKIWVNVALFIGVILPGLILIFVWQQPLQHQFLSYYLIVFFLQLASEFIFKRWFCKSVVVIIGILYTGFRIWQLWSGLHSITYPQPWFSLLEVVFIFWIANLIMLFTLAFPSIMPETE